MIKIADKSQCCGCTACEAICAQKAISMKPDALGFLYPEVDASKCTDCGRCEEVCAFKTDYGTADNFLSPIAYGARHKDMDEVMKSRSGAVFVALSDYVLERGGVVYGAGYKDHFRVAHKRATTKEVRDEFRGSKYVQSDLAGVFQSVKDDLKEGLFVMFSGTPCQTAGLKSYIGKKLHDKLLLIDIICHGVPSPYIWRDYIKYLEKKNGSVVTAVDFRDKTVNGWADHQESFVYDTGQKDVFTFYTNQVLYSGIALRKSCTKCPFTNTRRPSDITLGDFWGWEKWDADLNKDDSGVSLVLCNTPKGKEMFNKISSSLNYKEAMPEAYMQVRLEYPAAEHSRRDDFEKDYAKRGFEYVMYHDYNKSSFMQRVKRKIKKFMQR